MFWTRKKTRKPRRIGLSLSGGGMRGIGHIGALKALEEHGYKPAAIAGSSAGALVGALYAAGYSPGDILDIVAKHDLFPATAFRFGKNGFINTRFLVDIFKKYVPENTFESLKTPLYVAATNLKTGQTEYFSKGPLDQVLLASSSVPFVFSPVELDSMPYYDGGLLDNLPIAPLQEHCNFLIGVHVNALDDIGSDALTPIKTMDRIIHMAISRSVSDHSQLFDLYIEPPGMLQFGMFDKKKQKEIYQHVYDYTAAYLSER